MPPSILVILRSMTTTVYLPPTRLSTLHTRPRNWWLTQAPGLLRTMILGPDMTVWVRSICRSRLLSRVVTRWLPNLASRTCLRALSIRRRRVRAHCEKRFPAPSSLVSIILHMETGNRPLSRPHRGRQFTETLPALLIPVLLPLLRIALLPLLPIPWKHSTAFLAGPTSFRTRCTRAAPLLLPGLTTLRQLLRHIARPMLSSIRPLLHLVDRRLTPTTGATRPQPPSFNNDPSVSHCRSSPSYCFALAVS